MDQYGFEDKFSDDEIKLFKEAFMFFDRNGDGTVTFKEWQAYLKEQKAEAKSSKASQKGYEGLSKTADKSQSFAEMYRKLKAAGG